MPLPRAHAHNDYQHERPLLDALDHGFGSIEADIHLINGNLLVAHNRDEAQPDRTLQGLYLDPLRQRIRRSAFSRWYPFGLLLWAPSDIPLVHDGGTETAGSGS